MSKYATYYNKAVDLYKEGHSTISPSMVYGSDFYTNDEGRILDRAIRDFTDLAYRVTVRTHPSWIAAVKSGASAAECWRAWKKDDPDGKYLDEIKHI